MAGYKELPYKTICAGVGATVGVIRRRLLISKPTRELKQQLAEARKQLQSNQQNDHFKRSVENLENQLKTEKIARKGVRNVLLCYRDAFLGGTVGAGLGFGVEKSYRLYFLNLHLLLPH